jgi:hypothetical protein
MRQRGDSLQVNHSLILDAEDTGRIRVSSTVSCLCVLRVIISGCIS